MTGIKGPLVADQPGVSEQERTLFKREFPSWWSRLEKSYSVDGVFWRAWAFPCCRAAEYWVAVRSPEHRPPPCPNCDPVGARAHDARALDALARELWRARPDIVLAEMDRKLEAAELGGDALEALTTLGEYVKRLEAELERLRGA